MNQTSYTSLGISILAILISILSLILTYKTDAKLHRPYVNLDKEPESYVVHRSDTNKSGETLQDVDVIYQIMLKNFGDLPAYYNIKFSNNLYHPTDIEPSQANTGYIMPNQTKTLLWVLHTTKINVSDKKICEEQSEISVQYGINKNNLGYFLNASTSWIKLPVQTDKLSQLGKSGKLLNTAISSTSPLLYKCGEPNSVKAEIWTIQDAN